MQNQAFTFSPMKFLVPLRHSGGCQADHWMDEPQGKSQARETDVSDSKGDSHSPDWWDEILIQLGNNRCKAIENFQPQEKLTVPFEGGRNNGNV